jgi:hypothetical protein
VALNIKTGTLTQPGGTGNVDITLGTGFAPKAIILWGTPQTADGNTDATNGAFSMGVGTYRGSTVQQGYCSFFGLDAAGAADYASGINTTRLLKLYSASAPTVDCEMSLQSMADDKVTVSWDNLHGTASIRIHYMILGGSEITDAMAHTFACANAATQDVTVTSGFGQPSLIIFMAAHPTTLSDAATHWNPMIGVAKSATERQCGAVMGQDGSNAMTLGAIQKDSAIVILGATPVIDGEADLSATASWPTDGFRLAWSNQVSLLRQVLTLSLKGTFTSKISSVQVPSSVPNNTDVDHGSVPKGFLTFTAGGNNNTSTLQTAAVDAIGGLGIGAYDGTSEVAAAFSEDDSDGSSDMSMYQSTAKAAGYANRNQGLYWEADGVITGNTARLAWTTTTTPVNGTFEKFCILSLGDAAVVASFPPRSAYPQRMYLHSR